MNKDILIGSRFNMHASEGDYLQGFCLETTPNNHNQEQDYDLNYISDIRFKNTAGGFVRRNV